MIPGPQVSSFSGSTSSKVVSYLQNICRLLWHRHLDALRTPASYSSSREIASSQRAAFIICYWFSFEQTLFPAWTRGIGLAELFGRIRMECPFLFQSSPAAVCVEERQAT